ncbi:LysM peptidoglycan-binding domain-containing protein [Blastococcus deserti]|uniref:LysM peptidoglycan-binding domain-containing protein n=1 Tax=Blastococcus deserti TaxID=2259033 RepID=A0ABW4X5J6_9ACTN
MDAFGIQLRQPLAWDLIGRNLAVAALGTAFEATYGWLLRAADGEIAAGSFTAGSMGLMESFVHEAPVATDFVGQATFELFGDDPTGERDPGLDTQSVPVIVIGGMQGYSLHQVVRGDTLTAIARNTGSTVQRIAVANRLQDPNRILVGQVLRIPL